MSYGTHLTEDDKLKKEGGTTTPSTTPTTPTTDAPLNYEDWVGTGIGSQNYNTGVNYYQNAYSTAIDNIDKQTKAGYKYAQGVKDSTIGTSAAQRDETHRQTDIAKERSIVDARSDYQKAVGAYGTNTETLASNGLGGSGYGEWLQGNAYATMRGNVQNAQAKALEEKNAADYAHNQNVLAAEGEYAKNIYGIDSQAAKDTADAQAARDKGLYELGVGLTTDRANAYNDLMTGAQSGVSLESIMNDARWGDLTPEQQTAIENAVATEENEANFTTAIGLINDGWTLEEVKGYFGGDLAKALGEKNAGQLQQVADVAARIKKDTEGKTAQESLLSYLDLAATGKYTLDQLVAIATSLGHYDTLSKLDKDGNETGLWAQVVSKFEQTAQDNKNTETVTNIENAIADGATLEEIQGMEGYDDLDDTTKANIEQAVEDRDEEKEVTVDSVVANLFIPGKEVYSLADLDTRMRAEGVPSEMREEVVSRWQGEMANRTIASINDGSAFNGENALTGAALAENIKNGVYGDKGEKVAVSYFTKRVKEIKGNDILFIASVINDIDDLSGYLEPTHEARLNAAIDSAIKSIPSTQFTIDNATINTVTINGEPYKTSSKVADKNVASLLESFREEKSKQIIGVGDSRYLYKGGEWYELEIDKTRPGSIKPSYITNAKVTGTAEYKADRINGDRWMLDGKDVLWHKISNPAKELLQSKFADKPTGFYIEINGRKYMNYGSGEWRLIYTK